MSSQNGQSEFSNFCPIHPEISGRYIVFFARSGQGCGDYNLGLSAVYRLSKDGELTLMSAPNNPELFWANVAVDLNLDGNVEFLSTSISNNHFGFDYDRQLYRLRNGVLARDLTTTFPYIGCRC